LPVLISLSQLMTTSAPSLDESPATAQEWGYRPAQGSIATTTPPAFVWRPVKAAHHYALEIARDDAFNDGVHTWSALPWSSFASDTVLEPGPWFWRYAAIDGDGARSDWSQVRRFEVAADARKFPKPTMADLVERIPAGHPRLFIRPEEVGDLRRAIAGRLETPGKNLLAQADKLLASPPDTTEPPKYPKGTVRGSKEWKAIWWGNRRRAVAVTNGAATLAFAYQLTGDVTYGDGAKNLLLAFCAWDPQGATGYEYNDEAGMPLLYFPSRAYTWAHDRFSEEERKQVIDIMTIRGGDCFRHLRRRTHLWRPYASHSNRAWHFLGEVAIAFQGEIPEAERWLDYAMTIFYTAYPVWGGEEGGWHEGLAYWSSYMGRFMYWVFASQAAFDIDPFDKPFFAATGYYGMYTMPPGTKTGSWGDQAQNLSSRSIANLMQTFASGAQNGHWKWYAEKSGAGTPGGYMGIIQTFRGGGVAVTPPEALPSSRVFSGVGLAVLNTDLLDGAKNIQVQFKSSPFGRQSHGYNANNAFLLSMDGERVFRKTGKRDVYGSPHHIKWMWESKSDNAILVNGKGQAPHAVSATGRISHFQTSDTLDIVVGEAGASYENLDRWTRRIFFLKPHAVVIHDILEAPEASDFQWLLHATGTFAIDGQGAYWKGKAGTVDVEFLYPTKLAISQTKEYDTPPHDWANFDLDEVHLTAATTEKNMAQEFITLLGFNDAEVSVKHERKGDQTTLAIGLPDRAVALKISPDKFEVRE
ncbi:MAG: DUF4962 domain-containing protein, partial [Candidatus Hydrogenedentes bacterium]|nr:DUF4962 domain-containing protein [Candidatus Hydrogenedentota bacterium]